MLRFAFLAAFLYSALRLTPKQGEKKEGWLNKTRILLGVFVLGAMVALSMFYLLGSAGAANTATVSPSVTVSSTLSLTLQDATNVQWGTQFAGTTQSGTIQAKIGSNTDWALMVASDTIYGLAGADGSHNIASSNLEYTSAAGSPAPTTGSGVTDLQFGTSGTDVWTGGTPTGDSGVAVTYNLAIPGNQYPQLYSATHTYTLTATS